MASKENQEALNYLLRKYCNYKKCKECPIKKQCDLTIAKYGKTLQKALDDLEHYKKAYKVAPLLFTSKYQRRIKNSVKIAKEELENGK